MGRLSAAAVAALFALVWEPRPSNACSCAGAEMKRLTIPLDGAVDFPTDGVIRVLFTAWPKEIRDEMASEYRIREAGGQWVTLKSRVDRTVLSLEPTRELRPNTRYSIERVSVFSDAGERLSDDQRLNIARWGREEFGPKQKISTRRWFQESSFVTGHGPLEGLSEPPSTKAARIGFAYGGGDCGPGSSVSLVYDVPRTLRETDLLGIEVKGLGTAAIFKHNAAEVTPRGDLPKGFWAHFGDMMCTPDRVSVGFTETLDVRMFVLAENGRITTEQSWTKVKPYQPLKLEYLKKYAEAFRPPSTADALAIARAAEDQRRQQTLARYFSPPIDEQPTSVGSGDPGPAGCPFGLQSQRVIDLPDGVMPWMYGELATAAFREGRVYTIYNADHDKKPRIIELSKDDAIRELAGSRLGSENVASFGPTSFITASTVFQSDSESVIRVARSSYEGALEWSRVLDVKGVEQGPRVAWSGGRVLVARERSTPSYESKLAWALLDDTTGKVLAQSPAETPSVDHDAGLSVTHDGKSFLIQWGERELMARTWRVAWARLDDNGQMKAINTFSETWLSRVLWAPGGVTAFSDRRGVHVSRLGDDDKLTPPVRVDVGTGEGSLLTGVSKGESLTFVAWRSNDTGYVTVLDDHGRVAPPTPIFGGSEVTIPAVAAAKVGVVAVYGAGHVNLGTHPRAERFVCRDTSDPRAPARISP
ncbi:MAG: hypothetical protein HY791_05450 [Deltaproteobacteria bacterium]|nr:hypothetical protein [Deltaproteobacteria bacterium]